MKEIKMEKADLRKKVHVEMNLFELMVLFSALCYVDMEEINEQFQKHGHIDVYVDYEAHIEGIINGVEYILKNHNVIK